MKLSDKRLFAAVMGAAAAILAYQLFVPPIVGLADQGDFVRTIARFGYSPQHRGELEYKYVEPTYVPDAHSRQPYWEQASTEYLFVAEALAVNRLISKDGSLDITVAGFVHVTALLAALGWLLWSLRGEKGRTPIWIAAAVVLTDAGYAVYWNSFYAEPASCIFFLLLLAETVRIARTGDAEWRAMVRWSVWAVLWIFAKPQNAPIGLILAVFSFRMAAWTASRRARAIAVAGACALLACVAYSVLAMPVYGRQANTYSVIFGGILAESKDPAADLKALGLDPQLARWAGTGAWTPVTYYHELAATGDLARVNTFTVLGFYLKRPARMWRRLHGLLPIITFLRREYGNFEPSAGLPARAQSRAFTLWSGFHERLLPRVNKWIVFGLAAWPLLAARKWARARDVLERRRLETIVLLPLSCLAALFSAVYGDAFDVVKHMYLFNLLLDTCLIFGAVWAIRRGSGFRRRGWQRV